MMIESTTRRIRPADTATAAFMSKASDSIHEHRRKVPQACGGSRPRIRSSSSLLLVMVMMLSVLALAVQAFARSQAQQEVSTRPSSVSTDISTALARQRRRNTNTNTHIKNNKNTNNIKKSNIVQVFLLAGDDNVEGYAWSTQLYQYIHNESIPLVDRERYFHLIDPTTGQWIERNDVFVTYQHERHGDWVAGPLTMYDYGVRTSASTSSSSSSISSSSNFHNTLPAASLFGPEVEMGHVLGNAFPNDYILIVKAGWSGKSLAKDFASPSSSSSGVGGYYWHSMLSTLERAMDEAVVREIIEASHRKNKPSGTRGLWPHLHNSKLHVQLAGAVWFQGYPDIARTEYRDAYEQNLMALLRDLQKYLKPYYARNHVYEQGETESLLPEEEEMELKRQGVNGVAVVNNVKKKAEPYLPIIVGELGMSGNHASSKELAFREMQQRVCQMPEFNTTTLFAPTARYVIRDEPHLDANIHYYGRADTMVEIGNAFATGLLQLLFQQESFGESDNEREADYQAYEENMQSRFLITILLSLALTVLLLAIRRGLQQREQQRLVVASQEPPQQQQQHKCEQQAQAEVQEEQATNVLQQQVRENLVWSLRRVVQAFRPTRRKRKDKKKKGKGKKKNRQHRRRRDRETDEYGEQHDHDDDNDSHSSSSSSREDSAEEPNYNDIPEGEDLGSLPGSDSDLFELDEISSRHEDDEGDNMMMMDTIPRVV